MGRRRCWVHGVVECPFNAIVQIQKLIDIAQPLDQLLTLSASTRND